MLVTHDGTFHADDVFATAVIKKIMPEAKITRTRNVDMVRKAQYRIDIGGKDAPHTGDFDHHQPGGAGSRENGVPYASFGLVWKEFGEKISGSTEIAKTIERVLVQPIDASDNGVRVEGEEKIEGVRTYTLPNMIRSFNPSWNEDEDFNKAFEKAVFFATCILDREIAHAKAFLDAKEELKKCLKQGTTEYLVLEKRLPWEELVTNDYPKILYVIYPDTESRWRAQCVPKEAGSMENRKNLPKEWGGKNGAELAKITGVPDAIFCHRGLFTAGARSFEGAEKLVQIALTS